MACTFGFIFEFYRVCSNIRSLLLSHILSFYSIILVDLQSVMFNNAGVKCCNIYKVDVIRLKIIHFKVLYTNDWIESNP